MKTRRIDETDTRRHTIATKLKEMKEGGKDKINGVKLCKRHWPTLESGPKWNLKSTDHGTSQAEDQKLLKKTPNLRPMQTETENVMCRNDI